MKNNIQLSPHFKLSEFVFWHKLCYNRKQSLLGRLGLNDPKVTAYVKTGYSDCLQYNA